MIKDIYKDLDRVIELIVNLKEQNRYFELSCIGNGAFCKTSAEIVGVHKFKAHDSLENRDRYFLSVRTQKQYQICDSFSQYNIDLEKVMSIIVETHNELGAKETLLVLDNER